MLNHVYYLWKDVLGGLILYLGVGVVLSLWPLTSDQKSESQRARAIPR